MLLFPQRLIGLYKGGRHMKCLLKNEKQNTYSHTKEKKRKYRYNENYRKNRINKLN